APGRHRPGDAAARADGGAGAAPAVAAAPAAGPANDLSQVLAQGAGRALRERGRPGPRPGPAPGRRADRGPADAALGAGLEVAPATARPRRLSRAHGADRRRRLSGRDLPVGARRSRPRRGTGAPTEGGSRGRGRGAGQAEAEADQAGTLAVLHFVETKL